MIPIDKKEVFREDGFSITPLNTFHLKPCYGLIFDCYVEAGEAAQKFVISGDA